MTQYGFPVYGYADQVIRGTPFAQILATYKDVTGRVEMVVRVSDVNSHLLQGPSKLAMSVIAIVGTRAVVFVKEAAFKRLKEIVVERSTIQAVKGQLNSGSPYVVFLNCGSQGYIEAYLLDDVEGAHELARTLSV